MPATPTFQLLFGLYVAASLAASVFFWRSRDTRRKRWVYPVYVGAGVALFLGYVHTQMPGGLPWFIVAFATAILVLHVRATRFCDGCSAIVLPGWSGRAAACERCGRRFADAPPLSS